ncbi:hypothetical protein ISCGN_022443 [Ixodes scapularis]
MKHSRIFLLQIILLSIASSDGAQMLDELQDATKLIVLEPTTGKQWFLGPILVDFKLGALRACQHWSSATMPLQKPLSNASRSRHATTAMKERSDIFLLQIILLSIASSDGAHMLDEPQDATKLIVLEPTTGKQWFLGPILVYFKLGALGACQHWSSATMPLQKPLSHASHSRHATTAMKERSDIFLLQLCIEVELRFKRKVGDLEKKVKVVVEAFSHKEERECTFVDIGKHLQGHSRHTLINEVLLLLLPETLRVVIRSRLQRVERALSSSGRAALSSGVQPLRSLPVRALRAVRPADPSYRWPGRCAAMIILLSIASSDGAQMLDELQDATKLIVLEPTTGKQWFLGPILVYFKLGALGACQHWSSATMPLQKPLSHASRSRHATTAMKERSDIFLLQEKQLVSPEDSWAAQKVVREMVGFLFSR